MGREFMFLDSYPEDHDGEEVFVPYPETARSTPPGDMHEPDGYPFELDWPDVGQFTD